jgi:hypothetical protein
MNPPGGRPGVARGLWKGARSPGAGRECGQGSSPRIRTSSFSSRRPLPRTASTAPPFGSVSFVDSRFRRHRPEREALRSFASDLQGPGRSTRSRRAYLRSSSGTDRFSTFRARVLISIARRRALTQIGAGDSTTRTGVFSSRPGCCRRDLMEPFTRSRDPRFRRAFRLGIWERGGFVHRCGLPGPSRTRRWRVGRNRAWAGVVAGSRRRRAGEVRCLRFKRPRLRGTSQKGGIRGL